MAGVTLAEYMRAVQVSDPTLAGVVRTYIDNAPILGQAQNIGAPLPALGFQNTVGGKVSFTRQKTLPATAFRAIGTEFDATVGETETVSEDLKIGGGRVQFDRALINRGGEQGAIEQQAMMIASFARNWNKSFYKGDGGSNSFTGLQARLTTAGKNLIDNEDAGLNLYLLDKVLLNVRGDNLVLAMGRGMAARLQQGAKTLRNVNYTPATYGVSPATYSGVPILLAGEETDESEILDFGETADTTSIYVMSLGETGVVGAQTKPMEVFWPTGRQEVDSPFIVEWDSNFIIKNPRSAIRIKGIKDAAIVVDEDETT